MYDVTYVLPSTEPAMARVGRIVVLGGLAILRSTSVDYGPPRYHLARSHVVEVVCATV
eukprot:COSAG01_NODE_24490_length_777_cov_0.845133_1_plen_57_part_10